MDIFAEIIENFHFKMERPVSYGWFHLLFLGLTVLITVLLCVTHKREDTKRVRTVVLIISVIVALLEVYKQITYTFHIEDGMIVKDFQWYAFPFQFCSMPMYVGLLAGITKGKLHDCLCAFLATYSVFAGICVMVYPNDVFTELAGVSIQSMICHGTMIVLGVYLLYTGYVKAEHKTMLRALPVFSAAVALAAIMNEVVYRTNIAGGETFNMFFISPHFEGTLPVYSSVQAVVPFPWCLFIYIAVFTLASYVLLLMAMGIKKLVTGIQKKAELA